MIAIVEGEVRALRECKRRDGTLVKTSTGSQIYIMRVEQKTDGPTLGIDIGTEKNSRKVGDMFSGMCRVSVKKNATGIYQMRIWEI